MLIKLMSEELVVDYPQHIHGISISPKKSFCICKIWVSADIEDCKDLDYYNIPNSYYGNMIIKDF